jgi:RNA polymerase sigma-70 factor (ECF subfamily)
MMNFSDEKLFEEFKKGKARGFEELLNRYKGPLFTVILKRVRNRELAEDLFQETFMRVIEHADRFEKGRKFSPWLFRIALNLCVDAHRKRQVRSEIKFEEMDVEPAVGSGLEEKLEDKEIMDKIEAALEELTEEQREVFIMREYAGLSFKEIALATESPLNTVLGRMHSALKKLRAQLGPDP